MPRRRTGQLIWRKSGWYARVSIKVDGKRTRLMRALGTCVEAVARRKLERLLAADNAVAEDAARPETFTEAAERVYAARIAEHGDPPGVPVTKGPREELAQLRRYAVPIIGHMAVTAVQPSDINAVLCAAKSTGLSRATVEHLKQRLSNVFGQLWREDSILANPVEKVAMPRWSAGIVKERAVLTDRELAIYLAWSHPLERHSGAVRERQIMACISRMFGGVKTGDLHALRWEAFDVEHGGFEWGWAPRKKTRRPQLLEVPEPLRPFLFEWWERAGRPASGLVFPVRKVGKRGDRIGEQRRGGSYAAAFRRDLQSAFAAAVRRGEDAPRAGSARWSELFEEGPYTLRVDFESWRRAYAQALADANLNAQQAAALTGHKSLGAHERYLRSAGRKRRLPAAALPFQDRVE